MTGFDAVLVVLAGAAAGAVNAAVGSGTLITFPTLLAVGYPPVLANVTNAVGLLPGSLAAVAGYRAELRGQGSRLLRLGAASLTGALIGATLLLALPADAFTAVVPWLIALACLLVLGQPALTRAMAARGRDARAHGGSSLLGGVLTVGVYAGYFGAAQGVILIAVLGVLLDEDLQRLNAAKNVLAGTANGVAAAIFVVATDVAWAAVAALAAGAVIGGLLGARLARRLPAPALRAVIVVVGLSAAVGLLR